MTLLRFSSWHSLETKYQVGDYYYMIVFVEIAYSTVGQFTGEELTEPLGINFLETSGLSPGVVCMRKMIVDTTETEFRQNVRH